MVSRHDSTCVEEPSIPRDALAAHLLVAEEERIVGLPEPPDPFPLPPDLKGVMNFRLTRLETMCAAHHLLRTRAMEQLTLLKGRVSFDMEDPEVAQIEAQVKELGLAPRRVKWSEGQKEEALRRAHDWVVQQLPQLKLEPALQSVQDPEGRYRPTKKKLHKSPKYYARLLINDHVVGTSQAVALRDDFTLNFQDMFSVDVVHWPESLELQLFEKGKLRDLFLAQVYLGVPGGGGTPHVDPQAKMYQWTSQIPLHQHTEGDAQLQVNQPDRPVLYPSGQLFVRCGWVTHAQLDPSLPVAEVTVDLGRHSPHLTGTSPQLPVSPLTSSQWAGGHALALDKAIVSTGSPAATYVNPLALKHGKDADVPFGVMPPQSPNTKKKLIRRTGGKTGQTLKRNHSPTPPRGPLEPGDPLTELMKAKEAALSYPGGQCPGLVPGMFRLDAVHELVLGGGREEDKRMTLLRRRWSAGPYHNPHGCKLLGAREWRMPVHVPAAVHEALEVNRVYEEVLAAVETGRIGPGGAMGSLAIGGAEPGLRIRKGALSTGLQAREKLLSSYSKLIKEAMTLLWDGLPPGRTYKTDDVVKDMPLPQFRLDLALLSALFKPRRPLRPQRKVIRQVQSIVPRETVLWVTIQRASNMPQRMSLGSRGISSSPQRTNANSMRYPNTTSRTKSSTTNESDGGSSGGAAPSTRGATSSTFVEVQFRGQSRRTASVDGPMPLWNEQITFPIFGIEEEASPSALQTSKSLLFIKLFDEVMSSSKDQSAVSNKSHPGGDDDGPRYPRWERRYLGGLQVPLSAIYQAGVVEGPFEVHVPPVLLGYVQHSNRPPTLHAYITLRPALAPPPSTDVDGRLSGEQEDVAQLHQEWIAEVRDLVQCRGRHIKAMAVDTEGVCNLLPRYLAPCALPPWLSGEGGTGPLDHAMLKASRFVSLIPHVEDPFLSCGDQLAVWLTNKDVIDMAGAGSEERANLLAGYFQQMGQQAVVVLGTSLSGSWSAFVLTTGEPLEGSGIGGPVLVQDINKCRLWNPMTGQCLALRDPLGGLRQVGMVYSSSNIWANIQPTAAPWDISWSLTNTTQWKSLFNTTEEGKELATLQGPVVYQDLEPNFYQELEAHVEEVIRDCLYSARSTQVTLLHNKLSRVLKQLLRDVPHEVEQIAEQSMACCQELLTPSGVDGQPLDREGQQARLALLQRLQANHHDRLHREVRGCKLNGHIFSCPFSDNYMEAIPEMVLNTAIHTTQDKDAKFALAAHVETTGVAYVCCIWMYLVAVHGNY